MYAGGFGSGKTAALVVKACIMAQQHPGIPILIGRAHLARARLTTLLELERWLPPEWIRHHNKTTATWELTNGSVLQSVPIHDWKELQGLNVGAAFLDEAVEIPERAFDTVEDRTRVAGFPCSVHLVTNPAGRSHYLYRRAVVPARQGKPGFFYVQGSSLENLSTSQKFRTGIMQRYTGDDLARAVFGEWRNPSGTVWGSFGAHSILELADVDWAQPYRYERAIDFGFEHNFVCLWLAWLKIRVGHEVADVALVYREYQAQRRSMREHAEAIYGAQEDDRRRGVDGYHTWLEWDNQDRFELESLDPLVRITGQRAIKDRVPGHRSVQSGFLADPQLGGISRLYVADTCPQTIAEVEGYARPEGATREDQVIEFEGGQSIIDHCDALRYGFHSHLRADFTPERGYDPGASEFDRMALYA